MDYREIIGSLNPKEKEYMKYINKHVKNVQDVWSKMKELNYPEGKEDTLVSMVDKAIKVHDSSKYIGNEFIGYRQWFFPKEGEEKNHELFERAWNDHQKRNSHHWQYYIMFKRDRQSKALYMPVIDVLEMLCDWTAMSLTFKNKPSDWYNSNKGDMLLHEDTVEMIEMFLPDFDEIYLLLKDDE